VHLASFSFNGQTLRNIERLVRTRFRDAAIVFNGASLAATDALC
jgi:hypothetical protein